MTKIIGIEFPFSDFQFQMEIVGLRSHGFWWDWYHWIPCVPKFHLEWWYHGKVKIFSWDSDKSLEKKPKVAVWNQNCKSKKVVIKKKKKKNSDWKLTGNGVCCVSNDPHSLRNPLVFSDLRLVCPKPYKLEFKEENSILHVCFDDCFIK